MARVRKTWYILYCYPSYNFSSCHIILLSETLKIQKAPSSFPLFPRNEVKGAQKSFSSSDEWFIHQKHLMLRHDDLPGRNVCVRAQGLCVKSHTIKTAGFHQCNIRPVGFVCWGCSEGEVLEGCIQEQNRQRGNRQVCLIVWQNESQVLWSILAERKKCRFSFWSKLALLPFLWHPRNSRRQDRLPLTVTFCWLPTYHTKHTHTHTHPCTDWQPCVK